MATARVLITVSVQVCCLGLLAKMSDFYTPGDESEEDELDSLEVHAGILLLTDQSPKEQRADVTFDCCRGPSL